MYRHCIVLCMYVHVYILGMRLSTAPVEYRLWHGWSAIFRHKLLINSNRYALKGVSTDSHCPVEQAA